MLKITKCKDPCFASMHSGCKVLTTECEGKDKCVFYKPEGCEDWVRVERNDEVWLVPPEEYYEV